MPVSMTHTAISIPLMEITPEQALAAGELIAKVWPRPDRGPNERAEQLLLRREQDTTSEDKAARSFMVFDESKVIAHTLVFERIIQTELGDKSVMGLALVATDSEYRGQGLGALMVRSAFDLVDHGVFGTALFQTSSQVQPFYEGFGATPVDNPIINSLDEENPNRCPFKDDLVMRYPGTADWPEGVIDLMGPGY